MSGGQAVSQSEAEPVYDGPLYDISFTKVRDLLPEFEKFGRSQASSYNIGSYLGIEFLMNFADSNTIPISIGETLYCDSDFNMIPVPEDRKFEGYYNGYRLFLYMPENVDDWSVELYDKDMNLVSTTAGKYKDPEHLNSQFALRSGWIGATERSTGLEGFFNIYTQEWHPLASSDESLHGGGYGGMYVGGMLNGLANSYYSDGLAFVTTADYVREYYSITNTKVYEREVLGFLDENGEYAFRFDELPEFDGLLVHSVSGFIDGTCVVQARYDDGRTKVPTPFDDDDSPFHTTDFTYLIDKTGKIIEEVEAAEFDLKQAEVLEKNGIMLDLDKNREWSFATESIRFADGLTLSVEKPLPYGEVTLENEIGGYMLTDANGTVYPLDEYDIYQVIVSDDGRVFLYFGNDPNASPDEDVTDHGRNVYMLNYEWIAPPEYTLPQDQKANLTSEGMMAYSDFAEQIVSRSISVKKIPADADPDVEINVECERIVQDEDLNDTDVRKETASRTYRPLKQDYYEWTSEEDESFKEWETDIYYRVKDPQFFEGTGYNKHNVFSSCSWEDADGEVHTIQADVW